MNMYYLIFKMLLKQILSEVINALAEFIRQVLRIIFCDEDPMPSPASYQEPFE